MQFKNSLTHRSRVPHICVSKLNIIGSDNGLSPGQHQPIIWTNARILLTWPSGTTSEKCQSKFIYLVPFSRHNNTVAVTVGHRWKECLQFGGGTEKQNLLIFLMFMFATNTISTSIWWIRDYRRCNIRINSNKRSLGITWRYSGQYTIGGKTAKGPLEPAGNQLHIIFIFSNKSFSSIQGKNTIRCNSSNNYTSQWRHTSVIVSQISGNSIFFNSIYKLKQRKTSNLCNFWPFVGDPTADWWIPLTMGQ